MEQATDDVKTLANLAVNITALRKKQGLSQHSLAKQSGIPRSTIASLETGAGNPTLANLLKLSGALQISLEELIAPPLGEVHHMKKKDIPEVSKSGDRVLIKKLLPDPIPGMEIDRVSIDPKSRLRGIPHVPGTKEYMTTLKGTVTVHVAGDAFEIKAGDVLAFPGDQAHSYYNPNPSGSEFISVVVIAR